MNTKLLIDLYKVFSPSNGEKKMQKFIKDYVKTIPGTKVWQDHNNIYVVKGEAETYPCVVAHMDQVQSHHHSKDFDCEIMADIIFGYSVSSMEQQGLGADDKNGIWVALECLAKYDVMKCAFFWGEEIGCRGSSQADVSFFRDCRFVVQCDRRGGYDLIDNICGQIASPEFIAATNCEVFGYKTTSGAMSDVMELSELGVGISCVNMSCGYYNPHTNQEVTKLSELENCLHFVENIIENCTDVYPFENHYYDNYWGSYGSSNWSFYDDDDAYNMDFETMDNLLLENPGITFEQIEELALSQFVSRDTEMLREIYNDLVSYYGRYSA